MKKFTLLLLLLIGITSFTVAHPRFEYLKGEYFSIHHHKKLVLKPYKHGVKVKGLPWQRGWATFRGDNGRRFLDRRGNELVVKNHKVIIRSKWLRKPLIFTRNQHYLRGGYYENSWTDLQRYKKSNIYNQRSGIKGNRLSGVWYSDRVGKALEIQLTSNGLRSRFKDSKQWVYYLQIDKNEYEDERGNRFTHHGLDSLVWEDKRGDIRYHLYK